MNWKKSQFPSYNVRKPVQLRLVRLDCKTARRTTNDGSTQKHPKNCRIHKNHQLFFRNKIIRVSFARK